MRTDSLNFSLLIILMATFFPDTQCTPSFTRPIIIIIEKAREKKKEKWFEEVNGVKIQYNFIEYESGGLSIQSS